MFFEEFPPVIGSRPAGSPWFHHLADMSTMDYPVEPAAAKRWPAAGDIDCALVIPGQRRPTPGS